MKLACFNTQSPPQYVFNCCIITDTLIEFFYCAKEWACCDRKESLDQLGKYRQRNVQKKSFPNNQGKSWNISVGSGYPGNPRVWMCSSVVHIKVCPGGV